MTCFIAGYVYQLEACTKFKVGALVSSWNSGETCIKSIQPVVLLFLNDIFSLGNSSASTKINRSGMLSWVFITASKLKLYGARVSLLRGYYLIKIIKGTILDGSITWCSTRDSARLLFIILIDDLVKHLDIIHPIHCKSARVLCIVQWMT